MAKIPEGCFLVARKIKQSEIWVMKPSWWLKVWIYIIDRATYRKDSVYERGSNFFKIETIWSDCCLSKEGVKVKTIDNVIRWLRTTKQITTRKTTGGFIITVLNYKLYQALPNYKNDMKNESETFEKRFRNDTETRSYSKKERREEGKKKYSAEFELAWSKYPKKEIGKVKAFGYFNTTVKTDENKINFHKALKNYLASDRVKKGFVKDGHNWFKEWKDWINYQELDEINKSGYRKL